MSKSLTSTSHLRVIDGNITGINIPDIVEFEMKDLISALQGLSTINKFIKAYVTNGRVKFMATSDPAGEYTFMNPLGSDPQKSMSQDRDVYETVRRYRGPIIAICRRLADMWNSESTTLINRGFKAARLKFNEKQ